jgi:type I restriction enzyme R subunit
MSPTDTSEKGLETLIVESFVNDAGYAQGSNDDYSREHVIDLTRLQMYLKNTQPEKAEALALDQDCPKRTKFLHRLDAEIAKRGVIDVLCKGIKHGPVSLELFYSTPTPGNTRAEELHAANIFSVTRQLRYSQDERQLALDLALFINGLPVATFELKNSLTKQTVNDAVRQYKRDRSPSEPLFKFGRCMVHFAVDDHEVSMCTHLKGKDSWFLPFNQGWDNGAGNPPNPIGLKTDYLWKRILTKPGLTDILENYAGVVEEKDERGRKRPPKQIFPRYHQLDVVRKLLADAEAEGAGKKYLIQHSAGSGKSNSIAWLAHQLIGLENGGKAIFDSVVVITDRRVLDKQIRNTIKQFAQVSSVVGAVTGDSVSKTQQLSGFLRAGKKIIISTVQTFPFILDVIGDEHRGKKFAIIIDEAHSSQGGKTSAKMHMALAGRQESKSGRNFNHDWAKAAEEQSEYETATGITETFEDMINQIMESGKCWQTPATLPLRPRPRTKLWRFSASPASRWTARSRTGRFTATP